MQLEQHYALMTAQYYDATSANLAEGSSGPQLSLKHGEPEGMSVCMQHLPVLRIMAKTLLMLPSAGTHEVTSCGFYARTQEDFPQEEHPP